MSSQEAPSRGQDLDRLEALIGHWRTEGKVLGEGGAQVATIRGTDTYEWLDGRHFVIHRVDVEVGAVRVVAIEMIGQPEPGSGVFQARAYDNQGAITDMTATVDADGVWTFRGGPDVADAAAPADGSSATEVRATLTVAPDGSRMHAHWERSIANLGWQSWMKVDFTRMAD